LRQSARASASSATAPRERATRCSNYCGVGTDFIDFTVDRNPYKQGKYTPGTHIPILHPDELIKAHPDYVLILPWNLKDEILATVGRTPGLNARFVVPIPRVEIVG